jgi:hypothetical protein
MWKKNYKPQCGCLLKLRLRIETTKKQKKMEKFHNCYRAGNRVDRVFDRVFDRDVDWVVDRGGEGDGSHVVDHDNRVGYLVADVRLVVEYVANELYPIPPTFVCFVFSKKTMTNVFSVALIQNGTF